MTELEPHDVDLELPTFGECNHATLDRVGLCGQGLEGAHYLHARGTFGAKVMNDPIVDEVRRLRDAHASRFNYDLDAIFQDIKQQEESSGHKFVKGVSRPAIRKREIQPTEAATPV